MEETIGEIRKSIDEIDQKIIELLNERIKLCKRIAMIKRSQRIPIKDEKREMEIINRVGIFSDIFKEIIKICRKYEEEIVQNGQWWF